MKKLILVDGYSFVFRAFFAIKNLTRSDGMQIGALYGFTRMLIKLITSFEYSHIAVVFDTGRKTFRNEIFSEYKTNRPPCPEELIKQFPLVRDVVNILNIKILEKIGYEADDIIATYSKIAEENDFEVLIVSSDKDLMQLVDEKVKMYDGMKDENIDMKKVIEKWEVEPKKILDVLSLSGDSSDNVPGVRGIGEKGAKELIKKYGSLENVYQNLDKMKKNKKLEYLENGKESAFLSKQLITLKKNVPLDYNIEDLAFKQYDYKKFIEFLNFQGFKSMVLGLEKAFQGISITKNEIIPKKTQIEHVKNIKNIDELKQIITETKNDFYFYIFNEDNDYFSKPLAFSFCINDKVYSIKIEENSGDLFSANINKFTFDNILDVLKPIFENNLITKISYNIKRQIKILNNYKILINNQEDLAIVNYILNAGLVEDDITSIIEANPLITEKNEEFIELVKKHTKKLKFVDKNEKSVELAVFILKNIISIYKNLRPKINEEKLIEIYNLENSLTHVLSDMEILGIKVDINKLNNLSKEFDKHINNISKNIYLIAGEEFNIASPKQLGDIIFGKLKLDSHKKSSKSGNLSSSVDILEEFANDGVEICKNILEWRRYSKLKNTYTDVFPNLIDKESRIHTTYINTSVISGRLASVNPNLQNIPIKTEEGKKIRETFIAKNGYKLISADYKQAELRIIANYQNVKKLKDFFLSGKDIHTMTASQVFKIPENEVISKTRSIAKAINFSIIYGTTFFGLAKRINSSNNEAKEYLKTYFQIYPEIKEYIEKTKLFVNENNFVETMFGRKCNINIKNAKPMLRNSLERVAINAPIQGTAADIIKKAMIILKKELENYKAKMVLQIHDELVLECPIEEVEIVSKILKNVMENVVDWEIKMEVDIIVGNNLKKN
jgi:DNA polymerase-1